MPVAVYSEITPEKAWHLVLKASNHEQSGVSHLQPICREVAASAYLKLMFDGVTLRRGYSLSGPMLLRVAWACSVKGF